MKLYEDTGCTTASSAATHDMPTLEEWRRLQRELERLRRENKAVDVFVLTHAELAEIREHVEYGRFDRFAGVPVEVYGTKEAVYDRARELAINGKRVGLASLKNS